MTRDQRTGQTKIVTTSIPNRIDAYVGAALARLRIEAGVSRAALARELNVGAQALEEIEAGRQRASAALLIAAAHYFGVSTSAFYRDLLADDAPAAADNARDLITVQ